MKNSVTFKKNQKYIGDDHDDFWNDCIDNDQKSQGQPGSKSTDYITCKHI